MKPFEERYALALDDLRIRDNLLTFQRDWRLVRDAEIENLPLATRTDFETLRQRMADAKKRVVADLDGTIARFRAAAEAAGSVVAEVSTASAATKYVSDLCEARGVELVVKGKSMLSEEIELNEHLAHHGIVAIETDLGEWLLQLAGERPSHLVMPAIHKSRHQIAAVLTASLGRSFDPDDIDSMVAAARTELRDAFVTAGVGITGANAIIATTGTTMLVTNEGNAQLAMALPPVHVVLVGIEKLVESPAEAMLQLRLLARSATGQSITSYTSFITGPRSGQEQHIVLVDNGRREMADDPDFATALACIRCGACANVCPPFQVVGGHAFGHIYTGPIGLINTLFHHGADAAAGPQSLCVSCGACTQVCPVAIPLGQQILEVRHRVTNEVGVSLTQRAAIKTISSRRAVGALTRTLGVVLRPLQSKGTTRIAFPKRHVGWRTPPAVPVTPARSILPRQTPPQPIAETAVSGRQVTLFLQCVTDRLIPSLAIATADLLSAAGARVNVPKMQHCCGLPALDTGDRDTARTMAKQTIDALEGDDDVVTPAPSCVVAIREFPNLLADEPLWYERAVNLVQRTHDAVSYLLGPARLSAGILAVSHRPSDITVHPFCQGVNVLGHGEAQYELLRHLCDEDPIPLPESDVCCGFGGSTSITVPEVSAEILSRKLDCVDSTLASTLITDNPGCLLHLRGGVRATDRTFEVRHVLEYLADRLPQPNQADD